MNRGINACLTDKKVMIDDRYMVLCQLDIKFNILRAQISS